MSSIVKSQRSKRRKLKEELSVIQNIYSSEVCNVVVTESHRESPMFNDDITLIPSSTDVPDQNISVALDTSTEHSPISTLFNENVRQSSSDNLSENKDNFHSTYNEKVALQNASSKATCFKNILSLWALECNVPQVTLNKLLKLTLKLMKEHEVIYTKNLPLDSRTLLNTPKSNQNPIRSVNPGHYYHFGLAEQIQRFAPHNLTEIKVVIGIDGLPLAKSSNNQLWPILAYIVSSEI